MIFYSLFRRASRRNDKHAVRITDKGWTPTLREFAKLCQRLDRCDRAVPGDIRKRIEDLLDDEKKMRSFRLMTPGERKRAGDSVPRIVVEPSLELRNVMAQATEFLEKPTTTNDQDDEERIKRIRMASRGR